MHSTSNLPTTTTTTKKPSRNFQEKNKINTDINNIWIVVAYVTIPVVQSRNLRVVFVILVAFQMLLHRIKPPIFSIQVLKQWALTIFLLVEQKVARFRFCGKLEKNLLSYNFQLHNKTDLKWKWTRRIVEANARCGLNGTSNSQYECMRVLCTVYKYMENDRIAFGGKMHSAQYGHSQARYKYIEFCLTTIGKFMCN